mmetsp:Transcript_24910/g.59345  ORF Transcript_24910/g.59345 Transcript_24910/m.59345 type:complete len:230 (+) Transcript_24910:2971-3660(+)
MQPELRGLPLLERLEDQRDGAEVGAVEAREGLNGLGVVLGRGPSDEREASQVDDRVGDNGTLGEQVLHRAREVEAARVDADHPRAARFQLLDEGGVVSLVLGVDVALLEDHANRRGGLGVDAKHRRVLVVVPLVVLSRVLEDPRGEGVPDTDVRKEHGLRDLLGLDLVLVLIDVGVGHHEEKSLEVLRGAAEPVLEGKHEGARVLGLVRGEVLEHLRQRAQQLEHRALE